MKFCAVALLALAPTHVASYVTEYELLAYDSVADPSAIVATAAATAEDDVTARFTVLTSRLIRMEQAKTAGKFEDRPTLAMVNRKLPVPHFTHSMSPDNATLTITTDDVTLTYSVGKPFASDSLSVTFGEFPVVVQWRRTSLLQVRRLFLTLFCRVVAWLRVAVLSARQHLTVHGLCGPLMVGYL